MPKQTLKQSMKKIIPNDIAKRMKSLVGSRYVDLRSFMIPVATSERIQQLEIHQR